MYCFLASECAAHVRNKEKLGGMEVVNYFVESEDAGGFLVG